MLNKPIKEKKCKNCGKMFAPRSSLDPCCSIYCFYEYKNKKKRNTKPKNTSAKFTTKTKEKIYERDKSCIWCAWFITQYHHIYYGLQAEHWKDRNRVDKGVGLCKECHFNIHHGENSQELREYCIDYINRIYGQNNKTGISNDIN